MSDIPTTYNELAEVELLQEVLLELIEIVPTWKYVDLTKKGYNEQYMQTLLKLGDYINQQKLEARIDELKMARSVDSQLSSADIVDHLENRLAELKQKGK